MKLPIPNLVFSTRSPNPASGSDFVREVVAESPGIPDEVRSEFARRADMAGSVLQRPLTHPVYMFCPAGDGWLFCRAVSLGLYRKGSNQLLVHGLFLGEEHLDTLGCNPLLLADEEIRRTGGVNFLEKHPGSGSVLDKLRLDDRVAPCARRLNDDRLGTSNLHVEDTVLGAAYEALAGARRVGLKTSTPGPSPAEAVLLHFHPDDRMELSLHTFYSHTRPLDYRLILLVPEDAAAVRGHFHDLELLDHHESAPQLADGSLGDLVVRLHRHPETYLGTVESNRVTYWSRRFRPPLQHQDATLCFRESLGESLTAEERKRLDELATRSDRGGLRYGVKTLTRTWLDHVEDFPRRLVEITGTEYRVSLREVEDILRTPPKSAAESWCLLALLTREDMLEVGEDWRTVRMRAWELLSRENLRSFLQSLSREQTVTATPILLDYVLADLEDIGDSRPYSGDWEILLKATAHLGPISESTLVRFEDAISSLPAATCLDALERLQQLLREVGHLTRPISEGILSQVAAAIALFPADSALEAFERLQKLLFEVGQPGEALRLLFASSLPLLTPEAAQEKARVALGWWLDHGQSLDPEIVPSLGAWGVSAEALGLINDWLAGQPPGHEPLALRRVLRMLDALRDLSPATAAACGGLLSRLALTAYADRIPEVVERLLHALPQEVESTREFVGTALAPAAEAVAAALENSVAPYGPPWELAAVAPLLAARNRNSATGTADLALLRLAVTGRILARLSGPPQGAAKELSREWPAFLRSLRGLQFLEERDTEASMHDALSAAVRDCLELLQDELAEAPPETAQDDPRYEFFTDLTWWQWSGAEGQPAFDALSAKLRLARTWGRFKAQPEWLWQRMEERVPPGPLRERAAALLPPRTETQTGWLPRLPDWLGGRG